MFDRITARMLLRMHALKNRGSREFFVSGNRLVCSLKIRVTQDICSHFVTHDTLTIKIMSIEDLL